MPIRSSAAAARAKLAEILKRAGYGKENRGRNLVRAIDYPVIHSMNVNRLAEENVTAKINFQSGRTKRMSTEASKVDFRVGAEEFVLINTRTGRKLGEKLPLSINETFGQETTTAGDKLRAEGKSPGGQGIELLDFVCRVRVLAIAARDGVPVVLDVAEFWRNDEIIDFEGIFRTLKTTNESNIGIEDFADDAEGFQWGYLYTSSVGAEPINGYEQMSWIFIEDDNLVFGDFSPPFLQAYVNNQGTLIKALTQYPEQNTFFPIFEIDTDNTFEVDGSECYRIGEVEMQDPGVTTDLNPEAEIEGFAGLTTDWGIELFVTKESFDLWLGSGEDGEDTQEIEPPRPWPKLSWLNGL